MTIQDIIKENSCLFEHCIDVDPLRCGGVPTLKGRRFTVSQLLTEISYERNIKEIVENFDLDYEVVFEVINSISKMFAQRVIQCKSITEK